MVENLCKQASLILLMCLLSFSIGSMIQLVNVEGAQLFYSRELYCSAFLTQWLKYFTVDFITGAEAYSELGDNPTVCSQETVNVFYKNLQTSLPFKTVKIDKLYENILN